MKNRGKRGGKTMGKAMRIAKKSTIRLLKDAEWMVDNLMAPFVLAYVLLVTIYV